ncbi:MAG: group III truncated hemoglobin [Saprospiraceae bacterium]|nr:group III truncated hemoglobin [Saprospiraceae bacterium]
MELHDITDRKDIELLVNTFYEKVKDDKVLSIMFAEVHWDAHLPVMYDFWENVIFHTGNYTGNPMVKHQLIHQKHPLTHLHFKRWLAIFQKTADELFSGPNATTITQRAKSIAAIMEMKIVPEKKMI